MRVLAAEDNRTNQLVFSKMLQDQALDLRFANNGEEAVAMAQSFQPELIFTDISMPVMDGQEATRRIRAMDGPLSKTPIVAMTAHAMEGDREWVMAAGLDAYLTKPLQKAQILNVLEKYRIKDVAEESPPMAFASRRSFSA
jgi:CheY-like chemotaxis protein